MAEDIIQDQLDAHLRRNMTLVEKIEELGGDLGDTRTIDFFFYAPTEPDANALSADLRAGGFTNIQVADRGRTWSVTCEKQGTVQAITAEPFVLQIVQLASKHLAEFDGWGTAV